MTDTKPDDLPPEVAKIREATRPRLEADFSVADMHTLVTVDVEHTEDDAEVALVRGDDEVVRQGAAGRYALVWFPADRDG